MANRFSKLSPLNLGLAGGIIFAIMTFLTTIAGIYGVMGGFPLYNALLHDIYGAIGFSVTWTGAILGAVYCFIDGFILIVAITWIYNKLIG
jgi:hypothetical protein